MSAITDADKRLLNELWDVTKGQAWEPPNLRGSFIKRMIEAGYLKRCAMRCGFEAFDTGVDWTEAGKAALLSTSTDPMKELCEAAETLLDRMSSTYRARNGREVGIQGDDGEKCWIVHSDDVETLRTALENAKGGGR